MQYPTLKITIEKTEEVVRQDRHNKYPDSTMYPGTSRDKTTQESKIVYEQTIDSRSHNVAEVLTEIIKTINEL